MVILELGNGKKVSIDGDEITAEEAIEIATKLTKTWEVKTNGI